MDGYTCGYQHPWDCDGVILFVFLIGYTTRTVPKGKTFGQQSLFRWLQLCVIRCRSVLLRSCSCLWSSDLSWLRLLMSAVIFHISFAARTVPKGKTFGQQSLLRWNQYRHWCPSFSFSSHTFLTSPTPPYKRLP